MVLQMETLKNVIPIGHKFLIIHRKILIIGDPGSRKKNLLFRLINHQPDIEKNYSYVKDPYEEKSKFLINKREKTGLNYLNALCYYETSKQTRTSTDSILLFIRYWLTKKPYSFFVIDATDNPSRLRQNLLERI